jgi:HEAT repeat protein
MADSKAGWMVRAELRYRVEALACLLMLGLVPAGRGQTRPIVRKADRVPKLILQLRDPSPGVRVSAARALGDGKDARAVEPLMAALGDSDDGVRISAARALGEIKDPRAVMPLMTAMKDAALRSSEPVPDLSALNLKEACQEALRLMGPQAVEPLIAAMSDSSLQVRELAAELLGKTRDARAAGPLFAAMKGTDSEDLRRATSNALAEIGEPSVDDLMGALEDQNSEVRWYAASALADQYDSRITHAQNIQDAQREAQAREIGPDDRGEKSLIAALEKHNMAAVAGGYHFFYDWGGAGSEAGLIEAINQFGKAQMIRFFLNHGDASLRGAAENWANQHGYKVDSYQIH